jgi:endonuclease/exonuclease/phosphatase family metal-dependent hydrolase
MKSMLSIRSAPWLVAAVLLPVAGFMLASVPGCGEDSAVSDPVPVPAAVSPTPTPPITSVSQGQQPTELRVAFINLMSPIAVDANNAVAAQTFEQRLDALLEEIKAFNPDIVAFNEVSWTKANGSATERITKALKMEFQPVRANPWFPGQSKEESDKTAQQIGFEEGELVLSRYPILRAERKALNPRTSETESRAALHLVIRAPMPIGEMDVYITHLTGGGDRVRQAQAADFTAFVARTRGHGPALIVGDLGETPDGAAPATIVQAGFLDLVPVLAPEISIATCCRDALVAEQPAVTARTDYIFARGLLATGLAVFGEKPKKQADGTLLYGSDHNGLFVTFSLILPDQ